VSLPLLAAVSVVVVGIFDFSFGLHQTKLTNARVMEPA
jgi:hypothetical protein